MASAQLQLVKNNQSWKLDRRTIEVGRAGIAQARAALAASSANTDAELYGGLFAFERPERVLVGLEAAGLEVAELEVAGLETQKAA